MQAPYHHALINIRQNTEEGALISGRKEMLIPDDNLVLLHDQGHNQMQNRCKDVEYIMIKGLWEPSVYCIMPVNSKGLK